MSGGCGSSFPAWRWPASPVDFTGCPSAVAAVGPFVTDCLQGWQWPRWMVLFEPAAGRVCAVVLWFGRLGFSFLGIGY